MRRRSARWCGVSGVSQDAAPNGTISWEWKRCIYGFALSCYICTPEHSICHTMMAWASKEESPGTGPTDSVRTLVPNEDPEKEFWDMRCIS